MVIVSKGIIEHVEHIKSAVSTNGLIMGTQSRYITIRNNIQQQLDTTQSDNDNSGKRSINELYEITAVCELHCQPNSHPFQTRVLYLRQNIEEKVGRSIARSRVAENNAIFDCKVLSRNHAVIWYSNGKFFVKDTKSSNGTFINDRRISQSEPEELFSGDIVKFGVDVIENSRKEVHGCIIAKVKCITPDGDERLPNKCNSGQSTLIDGSVTYDELRRLHHLIQETSLREETLKIKLQDIQEVIELTRRNASSCWQAMIDEDRLLGRIDVLENQLKFLQKNAPDDELKDEILKLQEDKCLYQNSAKEALRKVNQERMEAVQKLTTIERALCSSEDECSLLRDQLLRTQQDLQEVNARLTRFENECKEHKANTEKAQSEVQKHDTESQELQIKLKEKENELEDFRTQISALLTEKKFLQRRLGLYEKNENTSDDETLSKNSDVSSNRGTVKKWLENSDLNHREGSADIIKAICDDNDCYDEDGELDTLPELEKIQNNLHAVEKRLVQLNSSLSSNLNDSYLKADDTTNKITTQTTETTDTTATTTTTTSTITTITTTTSNDSSSSIINDGNQNIHQQEEIFVVNKLNNSCYDAAAIKTNVTNLMEICNEIFEYLTAVKSTKQFHKMSEDYKKLESKLLSAHEVINNLQMDLENRPTRNELQEKLNVNQYLEYQLNIAYEKITNLEEQTNILNKNKNKNKNQNQNQNQNQKENDNDNEKSNESLMKSIDMSVGTTDLIESNVTNVTNDNDDDDADEKLLSGSKCEIIKDTDKDWDSITVVNDIIDSNDVIKNITTKINAATNATTTDDADANAATTTTTTTDNYTDIDISDGTNKNMVAEENQLSILSSSSLSSSPKSITYPLLNEQKKSFIKNNSNENSIITNTDNIDMEMDMDIMNNVIIQHEEELIMFKEKYAILLNENIKLKKSIDEIKQDYDNVHGRYLAKLFMYGTLICFLISYFVSLYYTSSSSSTTTTNPTISNSD